MPVLAKVKSGYLSWITFYQILPKIHKHSLGQKIDTIFVEIIEAISIATFLSREEKQPWVRLAIRKTDTLKILLMVLWETKSLDDKKYITLSEKLEEIGKMLGGWNGQLIKSIRPAQDKQNSPAIKRGRKKKIARTEDETMATTPLVVETAPIAAEPQFAIIRFHIENPRVAIAVALYKLSSMPPPSVKVFTYLLG